MEVEVRTVDRASGTPAGAQLIGVTGGYLATTREVVFVGIRWVFEEGEEGRETRFCLPILGLVIIGTRDVLGAFHSHPTAIFFCVFRHSKDVHHKCLRRSTPLLTLHLLLLMIILTMK